MPRSEERGGMAARSEAEANSLLVYKSPARKGGVIYLTHTWSSDNSPIVSVRVSDGTFMTLGICVG